MKKKVDSEIKNDHRRYSDGTIYQQCREIKEKAKNGMNKDDIMVLLRIDDKHPAFVGRKDESGVTTYWYDEGVAERKEFFMKLAMDQIIPEDIKDSNGKVVGTRPMRNTALFHSMFKAMFVKDYDPEFARNKAMNEEDISPNQVIVIDPILPPEEKQIEMINEGEDPFSKTKRSLQKDTS